jgi:hypothetical protein
MTRIWTLTAVAAVLAVSAAAPALAGDDDYGYYRRETCYERDQDATGGGVVAGAIVGGAVGGPAGAVVGGALGGAAGDDSVNCRYERYEGAYYDNGYYDRRDGYSEGYGRGYDRDRDGYRQGYRDGYNDRNGYDYRLNGLDRGYHADGYYYRRSTYREGYYDRYGVWHPDRDSRDRSYRPY